MQFHAAMDTHHNNTTDAANSGDPERHQVENNSGTRSPPRLQVQRGAPQDNNTRPVARPYTWAAPDENGFLGRGQSADLPPP